MIDLNTLISNALIAAVQQATAPLVERIATLESACATQHEAMVAMRDRITAIEDADDRLFDRIAALENNPAQGVDTQAAPTTDITRHIIDALGNTDHPLFKRLSSFMDAVAEQAMDHHLECYNHDSYDEATSKVDDYDFDDFVTNDSLEDAVREAVGNLSFDISVS